MQVLTESTTRPLERLRIERLALDDFETIRQLNRTIFEEERVINQLDRPDLLLLVAYVDDEPIGFKVGYGESRTTFYSAKGGVLPAWRRHGVARTLLHAMLDEVRQMGYRRFAYDTFPNMHPGMTVMGLAEGFRVTAAGYNATYGDYRLRFEKAL